MNKFNTEITGNKNIRIKTSIISACCQYIRNNEIKKENWQDIIDFLSLKFKQIPFTLNEQDIIKEFKKVNINYANFNKEIDPKSFNTLHTLNKPCYLAIDWLAFVNTTSFGITSKIHQETVIRNLLSKSFILIHDSLHEKSKKPLTKETINIVLNYAINNNNYSNTVKNNLKI